jgi:hypothetical protein
MIKKVVFMLVVALGVNSFAQTKYSFPSEDFIVFHNTISAAERMYKNDSLLQAYAKYDIAFDSYKGGINPSHYFKAALCALKIKEEFKALHFLEKAILNGYEIDSAKKASVVFYNQNTKQEYETNVNSWQTQGLAARNINFQNEIISSVESNKKYSTPAYSAAKDFCIACLKNPKCNKTLPEYTSKNKMLKEKMKSDSVTAVLLLKNVQAYGFPNLKLVSKKACDIARTILLNYDCDKKNERLDGVLFKAMNDGYISPAFYAEVVDRRNLMNGLAPEFYEPLMGYEKTIAKDKIAVDKKRNKIGLYNMIIPSAAALKGVDTKNTKVYSKVFITLYDY